MQFHHLQALVEGLRREIRCPKCKNLARPAKINISSLLVDHIHLVVQCSSCRAEISVATHPAQPTKHDKISKKDISGISDALKKFKKGEIGELFKKGETNDHHSK